MRTKAPTPPFSKADQNEHIATLAKRVDDREWTAPFDPEAIFNQLATISEPLELNAVLAQTCQAIVELFGVDHSAIVQFAEDFRHGFVRAEYPMLNLADKLTIPIAGVPVEEIMLSTKKPVMILDTTQELASLGPLATIWDALDIQSSLLVPVLFEDELVASFSLDVMGQTRQFSEDEVALAMQFASQVGIAIQRAIRFEAVRDRATQMERLYETAVSVTATPNRQEIFADIVRRATRLLNARRSGIKIYHSHDECLEVVASSSEGEDLVGRCIPLGEGASSHLLRHKDLDHFIVKDYASWPDGYDLLAKEFSLQSVLVVRLRHHDHTFGTLYVEDMLGREYSEDDILILTFFANYASSLLANQNLLQKVHDQNVLFEQLVAHDPNAIVANDSEGNILVVNRQAEAMLGYHKNELVGRPVREIFADRLVLARLGRLLRDELHGCVRREHVLLQHKSGETIPVQLTALRANMPGSNIGVVGYFEDMRRLNMTRRRLQLLLEINKLLANAEELGPGLQQLTERMVTYFPINCCRVLLHDPSHRFLITQAAAVTNGVIWTPRIGDETSISLWPCLNKDVPKNLVRFLSNKNDEDAAILARWSKRLGLVEKMQSMMLVALRKGERDIGLLVLGAFESEINVVRDSQQFELVQTIAEQTAVHVDRLQRIEREAQRVYLLEKLDAMSLRIQQQPREFPKLMQEVIGIGVELTGCEAGGLYINNPRLGLLQLTAVVGLPDSLIGSELTHAEGLIGEVARMGEARITNEYGSWHNRAEIFAEAGFETVVGMPLKRDGVVEAVLFVVDHDKSHRVHKDELEILHRFAMRAAVAQQTSQLLRREQRTFRRLNLLQRINDVIVPERDLNKLIHVLLTGITAGYGLGFNRAAIFLLDEKKEVLFGAGAIGHLDKKTAACGWDRHHQHGQDDFGTYLAALEQGKLLPTSLELLISQVRVPLRQDKFCPFSDVLLNQRPFTGTGYTIQQLPEGLTAVFEPGEPLKMVPLVMANEPIGVLMVDNKFTQSAITTEDTEMLMTYANTAASTIAQTRRLNVAEKALDSFAKAGEVLIAQQDFEQVWHDIVKQTRRVADASQVRLILLDRQTGAIRDMYHTDELPESRVNLVRSDGLSMQIMKSMQPHFVADVTQSNSRANPLIQELGFVAVLGLPVVLNGAPVGVMWVYDKEPRQWANDEINVVQFFVNQVAIAYENAHQIRELQHQYQAAMMLAESHNLQDVLKQTAASAMEVLEADSAVVWSYDSARRCFLLEDSLALNIPDELFKRFHKPMARIGGNAETVLQHKWLPVHDIDDNISYPFLGESTRELLRELDVSSFQGIALQVDEECLGIIYVNYTSARYFTQNERRTAITFANYVALALKQVRLVGNLRRARRVSQIVAKLTTLDAHKDGLNDTLKSIVEGTKSVINCDAVTLYVYDESRNKFITPPTITGIINPESERRATSISKTSSLYKIVRQSGWHVVNDVKKDDLFKNTTRSFISLENIISYIAIPLQVGASCVGVMFINYRTPHMFSPDELSNLEMFADQTAVALHNSQLYSQAQQQAKMLDGLQAAAKVVTSTLDIQDVLDAIVEQAAILTSVEGDSSHIALVHGRRLHFRASYPRQHLDSVNSLIGAIDLDSKDGPIGIGGRAVEEKRHQLVRDVRRDPDYLQYLSSTRALLAVPILINKKVLGVIIVEHTRVGVFGEDDVHVLQTLAEYAATALENARLHDQLGTVTKMLEHASSSLDIPRLLRTVCQYLEESTYQDVVASIRLFNDERNVLEFKPEWHNSFFDLINDPQQKGKFEQKIGEGVCGYVAEHRIPATLPDVDAAYTELTPIRRVKHTRSEQAVPICYGEERDLLGVLHVQSREVNAFDKDNLRFLELLADHLAIAIHKAQEFEELKQAKGMVGSRTALVWMGMASNAWRHSITGDAATIRNMITLVRLHLQTAVSNPEKLSTVEEKLDDIHRLASRIVERPITPPLSQEEGLEDVQINLLIQERLYQLWEEEPYASVEGPVLELEATSSTIVAASPEWLRRALDLLFDNAIEAMEGCVVKRLTVRTKLRADKIAIDITDTGQGMSAEVLEKLWQNDSPQSTKADHLGRGLLMVQAILETYGGTIEVHKTNAQGTTMRIVIPVLGAAVST